MVQGDACDGVTLASTKGWVQKTLQDHEGVLVGGLTVQSGYVPNEDGPGGTVVPAASAGGVMPREDLAELAVQCALRLSYTAEEGAPPLRIVRAAPSSSTVERPVVNYDTILGGPKFRKAQGTVDSADWGELLAPFGVIKKSDPGDWRLLIDA